jgi:hypothetical protein
MIRWIATIKFRRRGKIRIRIPATSETTGESAMNIRQAFLSLSVINDRGPESRKYSDVNVFLEGVQSVGAALGEVSFVCPGNGSVSIVGAFIGFTAARDRRRSIGFQGEIFAN